MSNLSKHSWYELRVGRLENANRVVRYCALNDYADAVTRHHTCKDWYVLDVHCTARQHVILLAFIDGLEWAELE